MVTVIADKEDLSTPITSRVTTRTNDNERPFQYIKDYQEVDFHRSPSCKPLPNDLISVTNGQLSKPSINGTFFVQIDSIESIENYNNKMNDNQSKQKSDHKSLILTITDGITTIRSVTTDYIPNLNIKVRPGCKLLLNGLLSIKDDLLQLNHENTSFQHGSSTFPRPRSAYRGRGGGSYRPSNEGRRGGAGNSNGRYDNDDSGSNLLKRPPPKNTLMDFMTSLNISNDAKQTVDTEHQKSKERYENKRRNTEYHYQTNKISSANTDDVSTTSNSNHSQQFNKNNYSDETMLEQENNYEQLDPDDDSLPSNYRERRNPLPPRLQRVHEERTRRNTNRYYEDSVSIGGNDVNGSYTNGTLNNHSVSTSSSYSHYGDHVSYMGHKLSVGSLHTTPVNTYTPFPNMCVPGIGPTSTHLTYYPSQIAYNFAGIPSPPYHPQQPLMVSGYVNDPSQVGCRNSYINPSYYSCTVINDPSEDIKFIDHPSASQSNISVDENETNIIQESKQEDNDNNENKSPPSSTDQIEPSSTLSVLPSPLIDGNNNFQQALLEQHEDKCRDINNSNVCWKIGDMCLARWTEDQEFYIATIVDIQSHFCIVIFRGYNNYDKVHFSDLKTLPRDQQYFQYIPPIGATVSDGNLPGRDMYYSPRINYYPPLVDDCLIMPEAPPFPFNSAGTLYMYPTTFTSISRATRLNPNGSTVHQPANQRNEIENDYSSYITHSNADLTINSVSTSSKDSNDISIIDSTTISIDDNQQLQQQNNLLSRKEIHHCSIADAPINLVHNDDDCARSTSTESMTSNKYEEQQLINEDEKQETNSGIDVN